MPMLAFLVLGTGYLTVATAGSVKGRRAAATSRSEAHPDGLKTEELIRAQFTVQEVRRTSRQLVADGSRGTQLTAWVSPGVKGFEDLKQDDRVTLDYYGDSVLRIRLSGGEVTRGEHLNPGSTAMRGWSHRITITARFLTADSEPGTMMVEQLGDEPEILHVQNAALRKQLETLKSGDDVTITYGEAVVVGLHRGDHE
jgi:hypothetical protein